MNNPYAVAVKDAIEWIWKTWMDFIFGAAPAGERLFRIVIGVMMLPFALVGTIFCWIALGFIYLIGLFIRRPHA